MGSAADGRDELPPVRSRRSRGFTTAARWLLSVLWLLFLIVAFGDIGFDHPGRYGLDFGHLLLIALNYVVLFVCGIMFALLGRRYLLVAAIVASAALHHVALTVLRF